jgi:hypothetical protein
MKYLSDIKMQALFDNVKYDALKVRFTLSHK